MSDKAMAAYFEEALPSVKNAKSLANFLIVEINSYLNKKSIPLGELGLAPATLSEIVNLGEGGLSHKQCSDILTKVLDEKISPQNAKEELHIVAQNSDEGAIMAFINDVLAQNPQSILDFKAGKDRALGFLVGQVMKASHGKVNPSVVSKLLASELSKR